MWTVVLFIEENTVEVVPKCWLNNDQFCFWPKDDEKIGQKISSCEKPDPDNWKIFRIRFPGGKMKTFENIIRARKACQIAEDQSSFSEASDSNFERKKRKKKRILYSDESDEEEIPGKRLTLAMPNYKKPSNNYHSEPPLVSPSASFRHSASLQKNDDIYGSQKEQTPGTPNASFQENDDNFRPTYGSQKDKRSHMEKTHTPQKSNDLLHSVFRELTKINLKIDLLQQDVSILLQGEKNRPTDDSFFKDLIPVIDDPIELEEKLCIEGNYKNFVNFVTLIGGQHKGDAVSRALSRIITNKVASMYSWKGKRGKKSFQILKICNAVIEGIMLNTKIVATQKDIEVEIMSWLRHAPERLKREK